MISEQIDPTVAEGYFEGSGSNVSGYLPAYELDKTGKLLIPADDQAAGPSIPLAAAKAYLEKKKLPFPASLGTAIRGLALKQFLDDIKNAKGGTTTSTQYFTFFLTPGRA